MKTGKQRKSIRWKNKNSWIAQADRMSKMWAPGLLKVLHQRFVSKNSVRKLKRYGPGSQSESAGAIAQ